MKILIWAAVAAVFFGLGVLTTMLVLRPAPKTSAPVVETLKESGAPGPAPASGPDSVSPDLEVLLTPDSVSRLGIKTAKVGTASPTSSIELPGTVMVDAYREVKVTPVAAGIVTRVQVELGAAVKRGAPLATLFSSELADAQMKYLSMRAAFEADHKKLDRTEQLVTIGAASRQELEDVTAMHAAHETELEATRRRLLLLGLAPDRIARLEAPSQVVSDVTVPAPIDGVVTARSANLGQVVGLGQELFTVTDLSNLWVIGDLYEQDFQGVRVGSDAAVTTQAYPGLVIRGRVTYIDPRVDAQTRTAKVRVEAPNPGGRLRLGMFVTMAFTTSRDGGVVTVPRAAVQAIGDRQVVFVAAPGEEGKFVGRPVRLGNLMGDVYVVLSGLKPGEIVVTEGSFFLRAEALKNSPS
jgi:RND family efflux transporter MFP subunit